MSKIVVCILFYLPICLLFHVPTHKANAVMLSDVDKQGSLIEYLIGLQRSTYNNTQKICSLV